MLLRLRNWGRHGQSHLAGLLIALLSLTLAHPASAQDAQTDAAVAPALQLLDDALAPTPSARQNVLLRALRHLESPRLAPLFEKLAASENSMLKVHGQLGLAETRPDFGIDNATVAAVTDPMLQGELINTAFEAGLLPDDQARKLLEWRGLDPGVRLMLAMLMIRDGKLKDPAALTGIAEPNSHAQTHLEAALRYQLGDDTALAKLKALNDATTPERDRVRTMLIEASLRNHLDRLAGWATNIATLPSSDRTLRLLALEAGLRLGAPQATDLWQQQFASASDAAQRMRLAFVALDHAAFLRPTLFDPLLADSSELLQQIGRAGKLVAAAGPKAEVSAPPRPVNQPLVDAVLALALGEHPRTSLWAISYARDHASAADATAILSEVVAEFDTEPRHSLTRRLDQKMLATQFLAEHDPATAERVIAPLFADPGLYPLRGEALLAGLLKAQSISLNGLAQQLPITGNPRLAGLAAVLRARHADSLTVDELNRLGLVVQGVGDLPSAFRIQAAWLYLDRRGLADDVLARLTGA